ncbi:hypothetical protein CRUP_008451 [Coryphaenoides rupestris]|nr:hypothetical protein CRUP_008451 [Coryphaenoides rupestris]
MSRNRPGQLTSQTLGCGVSEARLLLLARVILAQEQLAESKPQWQVLFSSDLWLCTTNLCVGYMSLQSRHWTHAALGLVYSSGTKRPLHLPKHSWYTLKLLAVSSSSSGAPGNSFLQRGGALHSRSASVLVMRPQDGAEKGRIPMTLRMSSWSAVHREQ